MNLVEPRSSTWKTTARSRSEPSRSRWWRAMRRSFSRGSVIFASSSRPSSMASLVLRSKMEWRMSSLLLK